ncbi:heat shock 70 kDa protein 14-like [Bolinopsis microptera]|uniref:heat shock 70 kDa protein 14-like n=1 Tax=Bolinopsis microptera TaxID=2820187 RepID=UPI003078A6AD
MSGVGIAFGNSSAFVSVCRDGRSEIVANSAGDRSTATVVAHQEGELLTGTPAVQMTVRQPANTVSSLKSLLACKLESADSASQACKLEQHGEEIIVNFNNATRKGVSALVKCVFENLKETADSALGEDKHDTVISIPLTSSPEFRKTVKNCAISAGLNVLDLIPESVAALLSLDSAAKPADGHTAVVRVGGSSMAVTVVKVVAGMYSVVDNTEEKIGGNLFDRSVGKFLCDDFNRKNRCKVEENPRSYSKVLKASKSAKHNLSTLNTAECSIESLFDGMDLISNLSRPRFETLIQNDLNKIKETVQKMVTKHSSISITRVVLTGGTCKVPKVQSIISQLFPESSIVSQAPDEIISLGAATHAGMLSKFPNLSAKSEVEGNGTVGIPLTPSNIEVRVGDVVTQAVAKNTPLPYKTDIELPEGNVIVIEADGKCIAKAEVAGSDDKSKVSLHFEILEDCSIEAIIKDSFTNERTAVHIPPPKGA